MFLKALSKTVFFSLILVSILCQTGFAQQNPYSPFVRGDKSLGFSPQEKFIQQIYWNINKRFPAPVEDRILFAGAKVELKKLLAAYGINPAEIDPMPADGNILSGFVRKYKDRVSRDLAYYACARGMVESLRDGDSVLLLPSEAQDPQADMVPQEYGGLGILIEERNGTIMLIHPFEDGPGKKAGLLAGDIILSINGVSTKGMDSERAKNLLLGKEGTQVSLALSRGGNNFSRNITRQKVSVKPVEAGVGSDGIGYVKVIYFSMDFPVMVLAALQRFEEMGVKRWILDLRDNSGGAINAIINFGGIFIANKDPIMFIKYRDNERQFSSSFKKNMPPPTAVLVNKYTLGSAEVIAATLREVKGVKIIGSATGGKTTVQEYIPLEGKAVLKLTIGDMITASKRSIKGAGLKPDVTIQGADNPANEKKILEQALKSL